MCISVVVCVCVCVCARCFVFVARVCVGECSFVVVRLYGCFFVCTVLCILHINPYNTLHLLYGCCFMCVLHCVGVVCVLCCVCTMCGC